MTTRLLGSWSFLLAPWAPAFTVEAHAGWSHPRPLPRLPLLDPQVPLPLLLTSSTAVSLPTPPLTHQPRGPAPCSHNAPSQTNSLVLPALPQSTQSSLRLSPICHDVPMEPEEGFQGQVTMAATPASPLNRAQALLCPHAGFQAVWGGIRGPYPPRHYLHLLPA